MGHVLLVLWLTKDWELPLYAVLLALYGLMLAPPLNYSNRTIEHICKPAGNWIVKLNYLTLATLCTYSIMWSV